MEPESKLADACRIMIDFAARTGLSDTGQPPRRYLWTDAHAVCNFLGLYRRTGEEAYRQLATSLIDQVHEVLGRHREDDSRRGWISGLDGRQALAHPTAGGLRIGKRLNERRPDEPFDETLEWERDGQYFHYLTKWMHALCRATAVTGEPRYGRWAVELAKAAHAGFAHACPPDGRKRLLWKMSIDLSYPLVPSAGLHDALDAYVTYHELGLCVSRRADQSRRPSLDAEIADAEAMIAGQRWATEDPLGIGGILFDLCRLLQLAAAEYLSRPQLSAALLRAANDSLRRFQGHRSLDLPASRRLAFRELGLAIGLKGAPRIRAMALREPTRITDDMRRDLDLLQESIAMAETIERFWRRPEHRQVPSWLDHLEINGVMLATSLEPTEFLSAT
jgi:hypothetical protein